MCANEVFLGIVKGCVRVVLTETRRKNLIRGEEEENKEEEEEEEEEEVATAADEL